MVEVRLDSVIQRANNMNFLEALPGEMVTVLAGIFSPTVDVRHMGLNLWSEPMRGFGHGFKTGGHVVGLFAIGQTGVVIATHSLKERYRTSYWLMVMTSSSIGWILQDNVTCVPA